MKNLTKRELVIKVADNTGYKQNQVSEILEDVLAEMINTFADGDRIEFRNFGVFEPVVRKSRVGRNPKKPTEEVIIPDHVGIKFKEGKILKEKIAKINPKKI